jgi:hypothetical protein
MSLIFPTDPVIGQIFRSTSNNNLAYKWTGFSWKNIGITSIAASKIEGTEYEFYVRTVSEEIYKEEPAGETDGLNTIFILKNRPVLGTEHVYLNGLLQRRGDESDYTIIEDTIYFQYPPTENSEILCSYSKSGYLEIKNEIPELIESDGNNMFLLKFIPSSDTEHIFLNGLLQRKTIDYSLENNILVFNKNLMVNYLITCNYVVF